MRISDWSSDVCSSDLIERIDSMLKVEIRTLKMTDGSLESMKVIDHDKSSDRKWLATHCFWAMRNGRQVISTPENERSEEHTSELQSLMRNSYAVFCLKKNTQNIYYKSKYSQSIQ